MTDFSLEFVFASGEKHSPKAEPNEWLLRSDADTVADSLTVRFSVGKRLFLRFDGLSYHSAVYVNGRLAAEDMEGFLPVETEITSLVRFGEVNEITEGAEKAKNLIYKDDAGRNRLDYPIGSFWGEHIGGIWQDVWLIERPETYVADVFAVTDAANGRLTIRYELSGEVDVCSDRVEAMLTDGEGRERRSVSDVPATGNGSLQWEYGVFRADPGVCQKLLPDGQGGGREHHPAARPALAGVFL